MRRQLTRPTILAVLTMAIIAAASPAGSPASANGPAGLSFRIVEGGPLAPGQAFAIQASGRWTAKSDVPWLDATPTDGSAPGSVTISLNSVAASRPPGNHPATVTVGAPDGKVIQKVAVMLRIVARSPGPIFTYPSGPHGCVRPPGYPDAATCLVPGEWPPGSFAPPPAGGSYVDPNFGARVSVLTEPPSLHGYSAPTALNATNTYAVVALAGQPSVIEVPGGSLVGRIPTSFEGVMWDATEPTIFYFLAGSTVNRYDVRTGATTVLIDYAKSPEGFSVIKTGSRVDTSRDNWIALFAPRESAVCALDLAAVRSYCAKYDRSFGGILLDATNGGALISKGVDSTSGKRYVILDAAPALAVFSVNRAAGTLDFEHLGPEQPDWGGNGNRVCDPGERCLKGNHFDTFEDAAGTQYLLGALETRYPCEYAMYSLQLNRGLGLLTPIELGGGSKRLLTLFRCGGEDTWADWHAGCAKLTPYCVVSTTYGNFQFQKTDPKPIKRTPHLSEVFVIRGNGLEIRRLIQHRSIPLAGEEARSYWTTPRACISYDGAYVVADSNFGVPNAHRVLLVETGFGPTAARPVK